MHKNHIQHVPKASNKAFFDDPYTKVVYNWVPVHNTV